ncbi:MAG: hypothetical protein O0X93_01770 [Methanocorpusculum sp.]|nr:hypothetical protein [Methanocorpusculum sp.]MDE2521873.1 hypothetical protein [Methanocorpusculum sp.]MDE2524866.1 hypothetical protein [Methanocorpusculum sp.]
MSSAGIVKFAIAVFLVAFYWIFLSSAVDTLVDMAPAIGPIVSQDRLDTMSYIALGFKIAPLMLVLAYGLNLWVNALRRTEGRISGIKMVFSVYGALFTLLILCLTVGAFIDQFLYQFQQMPSPGSLIPAEIMYMSLGYFYPLLTILIGATFAGMFIQAVRMVDYTQSRSQYYM